MIPIIDNHGNHSFSGIENKWPILMFITICFAIAIITQFSIRINPDVGSHIILSQRMMNNLPVEDPNPPLFFYLLMIPNILANVTKLSVLSLYRIIIFILIIISVCYCNKMLNDVKYYSKNMIIMALVFVLTLFPRWNFGQREHVLVILIMPYCFLVWRRFSAKQVNQFHAAFMGVLAGIGFCLKPHYLLIPLLLQLYSTYESHRIFIRKDIENIIIGTIVVIYTIIIFAFHHEYITKTIPQIIYVYSGYNTKLSTLLYKISPLSFILAIYCLSRKESYGALCNVLLVVTIVNAINYVIQEKGGDYQLYLFLATSFLIVLYCIQIMRSYRNDANKFGVLGNILLVVTIVNAINYVIQGKSWDYLLFPFLATSLLMVLYCIPIIVSRVSGTFKIIINIIIITLLIMGLYPTLEWHVWKYRHSELANETPEKWLENLIMKYATGSNIYFFSTSVEPAFPVVNYSGSGWSSRYNCLWMLPGILNNKEVPVSRLNEKKQKILIETKNNLFEAVLTDLQTEPPALIIVDDRPDKQGLRRQKFDFMKYFLENPFLKELLSHYQELTRVDEYQVFKRISKDK